MKPFMDQDFLLSTDTAKHVYHSYAAPLPILDYHCHINPKEIALDHRFENITQVWLKGDHYKWRQMRANGVDEYYITGGASDWEKFVKWAETLPKLIGNPLYHWSHLELQRYFGFQGHLNPDTARQVWQLCSDTLQKPAMSVRNIIRQSHVKLICTTDDPIDSLEYHRQISQDPDFEVKVLPTWRPDKAMNIGKPEFVPYIQQLSQTTQIDITDLSSFQKALENRMEYFHENGCRISDHALEYVMYAITDYLDLEQIFAKGLKGQPITDLEQLQFQTAFLLFSGKQYHRLGWAMQLHYGCKRDNNRLAYQTLGPDSGFDCISNHTPSHQLADFLNALHTTKQLPKTILYSLNPNDDAVIGTIIGCFQDSLTPGKVQQGSAWWFNDHKTGMQKQLISLANLGCLGNFIGMLTDSRSFLSYTRHEYFRRILCQLIGEWVENGEYPNEEKQLKQLIEGICYSNALRYFQFQL